MPFRGVADIVFCLDASDSMSPCFEQVRNHLGDFISSLSRPGQGSWDLRFDFLAHSCSQDGKVHRLASALSESLIGDLYGQGQSAGRFFTKDVGELKTALGRIMTAGNEATLFGLDVALDFPWREAAACHRVVILMTDEPFETGAIQAEQLAVLKKLIGKIQTLKVMLYLVTPESQVYSSLSEVDRCEHWVVDGQGNGLASADFKEVFSFIGKSVSVSQGQTGKQGPAAAPRALFGQDRWGAGTSQNFRE
jgi:hypothetical protein